MKFQRFYRACDPTGPPRPAAIPAAGRFLFAFDIGFSSLELLARGLRSMKNPRSAPEDFALLSHQWLLTALPWQQRGRQEGHANPDTARAHARIEPRPCRCFSCGSTSQAPKRQGHRGATWASLLDGVGDRGKLFALQS